MIDLIKAEKVFKEFLKDFDTEEGSIKLKVIHTYGVIEKSEYISKELGLNEEQIKLAKLIALLHDIGRFEQRKVFHEYEDFKGMDHAEYGIKILFEDGLIRNFIEDIQYDDIIYEAIKNHNKYEIDKNLKGEKLLQAKIIRDADKLDNFRVKETENFKNMFHYNEETIEYEEISEKVYETFMKCKLIDVRERITQPDIWISFIAFIFDLNFDVSYKYIMQNNCIDKLVDRFKTKNKDTKRKMEEIRILAKKYVESKIN